MREGQPATMRPVEQTPVRTGQQQPRERDHRRRGAVPGREQQVRPPRPPSRRVNPGLPAPRPLPARLPSPKPPRSAGGTRQNSPSPPEEGKLRFPRSRPLALRSCTQYTISGSITARRYRRGYSPRRSPASTRPDARRRGRGRPPRSSLRYSRSSAGGPSPEPRKKGTPRALILAPTRELVLQIEKDAKGLGKYTRTKAMAVFGGMDYVKQKRMLTEGINRHRRGDPRAGFSITSGKATST